MFGKIKDKLKNVFEKSEEIIEENPDEEVEVSVDELSDNPEEKRGILSRIFGKKKSEDFNDDEDEIDDDKFEEAKDVSEDVKKPKKRDKKKRSKIVDEEGKEIGEDEKDIKEREVEELKGEKIAGEDESEGEAQEEREVLEEEKKGFLKKAFTKLKSKKITEEDFDRIWLELELFLLEINVAYEVVENIGGRLKEELVGNSFNRFKLSGKIKSVLEEEVEAVLKEREGDFLERLNEVREEESPVKILILGVNGTGKTTTIAKIVNFLKENGLSVVVAASDTFRAAAVEQLEEHSKNLGFRLILHKEGSDPAAVAYDAIEHAKAKDVDVVLIDTAGRMPNNSNLMMELQKIRRVSNSQMAVFIGDSISGNDLTEQIDLFNKIIGIDGVILTKVDTDEKPGSIVTTAYSIERPIYFLGNGQNYEDLVKFDAKVIARQLFDIEDD